VHSLEAWLSLSPHEGQPRQDGQKHHQISPAQPEPGQTPERLPGFEQLAAHQVMHQQQQEARQGQSLSGLEAKQVTPLSL